MSYMRQRRRRITNQAGTDDWTQGCRILRSIAIGRVLWLVLLVLPAACARRLPEIRGRVLDARTGAPIAGAIVTRFLFGAEPINLVDSSRPLPIKGGEFSTRSRVDGTFILPPFRASGIVGMHWFVFASGFMPYSVANCRATWSPDGCTGFELIGRDPWDSAAFTRNGDHLDLEVRLTPPTLDGVTFERYDWGAKGVVPYTPNPREFDPIVEYFGRVTRLAREECIPRRVSLDEASAYAVKGLPLSDPLATIFLEVAGTPLGDRPAPFDYEPEVVAVRRAIVAYCDRSPASAFCTRHAVGLTYIRGLSRKGTNHAE